jgi:hypothetical protein
MISRKRNHNSESDGSLFTFRHKIPNSFFFKKINRKQSLMDCPVYFFLHVKKIRSLLSEGGCPVKSPVTPST